MCGVLHGQVLRGPEIQEFLGSGLLSQMVEWGMEAAPPHIKASGLCLNFPDFLKSRLEGPVASEAEYKSLGPGSPDVQMTPHFRTAHLPVFGPLFAGAARIDNWFQLWDGFHPDAGPFKTRKKKN